MWCVESHVLLQAGQSVRLTGVLMSQLLSVEVGKCLIDHNYWHHITLLIIEWLSVH